MEMKIQMWQRQGQSDTKQKKVYGPKLRLSCDSCSKSKVRCDHERPSCQRCFHAGVPCVYSVSRRTGKPSKSATNSEGEAVKNNVSAKSTSVAVQTESSPTTPPPPSLTSTSTDLTPSTEAPTLFHGSRDNALDSLLNYDIDMSDVEPLSSHFLSDHIFATESNIPLDENLSISNLSDFNESLNESVQAHSFNKDILSSLSGGLEMWNLDSILHVDASRHTSANRMDKASPCLSIPPSSVKTAGIESDQIHMNTTFCTTSPSLVQPSTIDRVLNTCRRAMTTLYTLLQCSCSQSSSSALSIALIILKILDLYGAIARSSVSNTSQMDSDSTRASRNSKDTNHESVSNGQSRSTTSSPLLSFPSMGQSLVLGAPITIGVYKICAEDERRIILNLLISELRRVELLVEEFGRQYEGEAVHREDTIYGTLKHFILSRVYVIHGELNAAL
ncbi:aflatoxin biosynthesis regulatory protein, putative [Talaromyces stipitatus ATCC 10500]|uniref:Aflatoxin biosynthesis regulatory protein, putative n=1 Tax=Talaromyces stipitatus (strain ATCC 10500 / CBS 375.48 / QM 6759 / NRRL 1006) TaxID=441959 RepID=B8M0J9_TALSN|nr:aflatoxin biosynthesis regulatory protein, putative [Talaromyces stipitatus ATCC 10500]EED21296.1 aflatoxin biosynthesis regulatory protein, putative [Talaromyces stipitatus ATCC 10500]